MGRAPRHLEISLAALAAVSLFAACKTTSTPAPERAPDVGVTKTATITERPRDPSSPAGQPVDHAALARAASEQCTRDAAAECFTHAEALADGDGGAAVAETALVACTRCALAPPSAFRLLASLRVDRDAKTEARDALLAGTRAYPELASMWIALARAELAVNRTKQALSAYATAERLAPDDEELARERRDVLAKHGADADRIDAKVQGLLTEAAGRAELGDLTGARDTLLVAMLDAVKVPSLAALVRHRLALVYVRRAEPKQALDELEKVLALETDASELRADAFVTQSEVLLALGKTAEAIHAAEQAIAIAPKHTLAFADLAIARVVNGDREGGLRALSTSVDLGLARRLTKDELLAIQPLAKLAGQAEFDRLLERGWPGSARKDAPK